MSSDFSKKRKVRFQLPESKNQDDLGEDYPVSMRKKKKASSSFGSDDEEEQVPGETESGQREEEGEEVYTERQLADLNSKEDEYPIIPFNLKEDRETGYFDEGGNYVWRRRGIAAGDDNERDASDAWLETVDESKDKMIFKGNKPSKKAAETENKPEMSKTQALHKIYYTLKVTGSEPKETVLQAIQRLGRKGKTQNIKKLEELSSAASNVIEDLPNIYQETKSKIHEMIKPKLEEKMKEIFWQYKMKLQDSTIHGPYDSLQMQEWKNHGYFTEENSVYLRKCTKSASKTENKKPKISKSDLKADLLGDSESENEDEAPSQQLREKELWIASDQVDFENVDIEQ